MVYDEGFNLEFDEFSFFTFFKYTIDIDKRNTNYLSFCHSTLIGWYNNQDKSQWGCFKATKVGIIDFKQPNFVKVINNFQNLNISTIDKISNYNKLSLPSEVNIEMINPTNLFHTTPILNEKSNNDLFKNLKTEYPKHSIYLNTLNNRIIESVTNQFFQSNNELDFNPLEIPMRTQYSSNIKSPILFDFKQIEDKKGINEKNFLNKKNQENDFNITYIYKEILKKNFNSLTNKTYIDSEILIKFLDDNKNFNLLNHVFNTNFTNSEFENIKYIVLYNIKRLKELNKINKSWEAGLYKEYILNKDSPKEGLYFNLCSKKAIKRNKLFLTKKFLIKNWIT